jgi:ABC-type Fe3+ transport system substrate-binding protein
MTYALIPLILLLGLPSLAHPTPAWQAEWERVLQAAKREGKVAVSGPEGSDTMNVLTQPFQKKYGIRVEFHGATGRELSPRVLTERRAGHYLWDVYVHGTTTALTAMIPAGALDSLEPALILPEVKDPKHWRGGALEFLDEGRRLLVMTPSLRGTIFVNTSLVDPKVFRSYKDLLEPKWKGKMVIDDPRRAGPGQATFTFFYLHQELGPDFIRALAKQEPLFLRDYSQEIDAIGQGKYLVLVGTWEVPVEARIRQGVPLAIVNPHQLREGSDLSPVNGSTALYNRAPHPNAAKLYLNWLLSKEGQTEFTRAMGYISSRLDVPTEHSPWRVPTKDAIKTYTPAAMDVKDKLLVPLLREVFGR